MVGLSNKEVIHTPFSQALKNKKALNPQLLELTNILSI
jgi:6-phosphofructokinase 1